MTDDNTKTTVVPLKGMRGMIAANMRRSLDEAAQLTHHANCDISGLLDEKTAWQEQGVKMSMEDLIAQRVVETLTRHPKLNGVVENNEIHFSAVINLGVAIALPGDLLMAPAILNAGQMTLQQRAEARKDVVARARSGKITAAEMKQGTFTLTNLGLSRVEHFTPVINIPQIAILGIGHTRQQLVLQDDGGVIARPMMGLSLTFDHRAVDGGPAANFLTDLCQHIEAAGSDECAEAIKLQVQAR